MKDVLTSRSGNTAITHYKVLKSDLKYSLVNCLLETGRTHQIRVHLAYIGHPIVSDTLYGTKSDDINRQALHAYKVSFIHPITQKNVTYISNLPNDIGDNFLDKFTFKAINQNFRKFNDFENAI